MNVQLTCPICRGDAELGVIPEGMGRHENVRTRITNLPVLCCTYCHHQAPRYYDFVKDAARILSALCDLPVAKQVGFFFKQPGCCECKALLQGSETEPVSFPSAELDLTDITCQVDLSVLATLCPKCGTKQFLADDTLEEEIVGALRSVFQSLPVAAEA